MIVRAPADASARAAAARPRWRAWLSRPAAWPALAGLGLGLLALGPGLGPGYLLSYDMVFVPRMAFSAALIGLTGGPPRAVPSDAVVAVASLAVPADILQKLILLLIFVLACSGAAVLASGGRPPVLASGGRPPQTPPRAIRSGQPPAAPLRPAEPGPADPPLSSAGPDPADPPLSPTPPRAIRSGQPPAGRRGWLRPPAGGAGRGLADPGAGVPEPGAAPAVSMPLAARLAAGVCYAWNPYVAERLLIGQWALLLGYAGLPWVLRVLCFGPSRTRLGRLLGVMVPAGIGGFAAMGLTALAAVPAVLCRGDDAGRPDRVRRLLTVLGALALFSLVWLIPAFAVAVHTDPRGADAFAARADTPFGRLGSLLMLSGIWNAQTVPRGYGGGASAAWLLVVLAALAGYLLLARPRRLAPGLGIAALAGLAVAAAGAFAPGRAALRGLISAWPGFAVLRDGQQFLAPLALAEAIGLGALVAWVLAAAARGRDAATASGRDAATASGRDGPAARQAGAALAVMAVLAPVVLLPGLAWGLAGRLRPVSYPADWARARQVIDGDPARGSVLLLPWAAYRRYPWNGGEAVYDPWTLLLGREVISNDGLQVGNLVLAQESADSIRLNRIVTGPGPLTRPLLRAGVRYVVVDAGPLLGRAGPGLAARARLPGARVVLAGRDLVVFRLAPPGGPGR
jgi:hypothetical protein